MANTVHAQILRGFRNAAKKAGADLRARGVETKGIVNPRAAGGGDSVDPNPSDDTAAYVTMAAEDFSAGLPEVGESIRGQTAEGATLNYRIVSLCDYVPGNPLVHFACANVVSL